MSYLQIGVVQLKLDARTMNSEIKRVLGHKAESITKHPDLRRDIAQVFLDMVEKYVPMSKGKPTSGHLRAGGHVESGGHSGGDARLVWFATDRGFDYATQQFYNQYNHYTTPGTGSNWTGALIDNEWAEYLAAIEPLILEAYKEGLSE